MKGSKVNVNSKGNTGRKSNGQPRASVKTPKLNKDGSPRAKRRPTTDLAAQADSKADKHERLLNFWRQKADDYRNAEAKAAASVPAELLEMPADQILAQEAELQAKLKSIRKATKVRGISAAAATQA